MRGNEMPRPSQIRTCAGRLPESERQRFLDLQAAAAKLTAEAAELRAEAWAIFWSNVRPHQKEALNAPDRQT